MQTLERLSLMGGAILLTSTLVFTLKGQASHILPKITHPLNNVYQHAGDAQKSSDFNDNFQQAQQKGYWGTAPWYISRNNDMHVGSGRLRGNLYNTIGDSNAHAIRSINFETRVQAPQDSSWLLAASRGFGDNNHVLQAINGTQNIDTSSAKYMGDMFSNDMSITNLDLSDWDTSHVVDMNSIFDADESLRDLNVADWNVSQVQNLSWAFYLTSLDHLDLSGWQTNDVNDTEEMFDNDKSLRSLDLSHFDTSHLKNMIGMYNNDRLSQVALGDNTHFSDTTHLQGDDWQSKSTRLSNGQLLDDNVHPGTWLRQ